MPDSLTAPAGLEPIILAFSGGRRVTLGPEIAARIWEEVRRGVYSGPEELIHRAQDAHFRAMEQRL